MNVLIVIPEMGAGGAEAVVAELALGLATEEATVRVAATGGWRSVALAASGVPTVEVPLRRRRTLFGAVRTLRSATADERPDLISAHNVRAALIARLAVGRRRRGAPPVVATLHGVPDRAYPLAARVLRWCADLVVAVSPGVAHRVVEAGFPADRITVIENGVAPMVARDRRAARNRVGVADEIPLAVCVARLVPQKRHDLLLTAWAALPGDAMLLVVGTGETAAALARQIAADPRLASRVRLLGERRDVDWLLSAADVAVLPTDWEGLPISVLEAMSVGVPVVASAVPELVATLSGAAELVDPGSAAALAEGLRRVLTEPGHAQQLALAGSRLVADRFDVARMRAQYLRCFTAALSPEEIPA